MESFGNVFNETSFIVLMVAVTAIQMEVKNNIEKNLKRMLHHIDDSKDSDIIVFPEVCLINDEKDAKPIHNEIRIIHKKAREHSMHLIFGSYALENDNVRNRIYVLSRDGKRFKYAKKNLYESESEKVKAGRSNRVIPLDICKIGVINCWDYAYPEQARDLARSGAQIIFCPSYLMSHPMTKDVLYKIPQVRAFDTLSYFVMVDAYADDTFQESKICHPLRELASISKEPGKIRAELNLDDIPRLREKYPHLNKSKPLTSKESFLST